MPPRQRAERTHRLERPVRRPEESGTERIQAYGRPGRPATWRRQHQTSRRRPQPTRIPSNWRGAVPSTQSGARRRRKQEQRVAVQWKTLPFEFREIPDSGPRLVTIQGDDKSQTNTHLGRCTAMTNKRRTCPPRSSRLRAKTRRLTLTAVSLALTGIDTRYV